MIGDAVELRIEAEAVRSRDKTPAADAAETRIEEARVAEPPLPPPSESESESESESNQPT